MQEAIVETKQCKCCGVKFNITDKDLEFYKKMSPEFNGETFNIPSPSFCPDCRFQRRLAWRNERSLYRRKCDAIGEEIVSVYSPDKPFKVYSHDSWWSDKWDACDWGMPYSFNKTAFGQFGDLLYKVPKRAILKGTGSENSDYVNGVGSSRDCYLIFEAGHMQSCYYGYRASSCIDCMDFTRATNCENCYEVLDCINCYGLFFSQKSLDCRESSYLYNCKGCINCFGCANLSNRQYYILNKQYSKMKYFQEIRRIQKSGFLHNDFKSFILKIPREGYVHVKSEDVLGDNVYHSKEVKNGFDIIDSQNISYCNSITKGCDSLFDVYVGLYNSSNIYESNVINRYCDGLAFCNDIWDYSSNLFYCNECKGCKNCFLSTCLTDKQYCILNKQYTKEEYNTLVPKIIKKMQQDGEWGEFFSSNISPFGYNETVASEYSPLTKEDAIKQGFNWSDYQTPTLKVEKIISADKLPDDIKDIPDDILNWAIECEVTQKPFKIIQQELEFYRKHNLPIPKRHPDQRHLDRMKLRNPRRLFKRDCDKCGVRMKTTYASERTETVYCEKCYNEEIY